MKYTFRIEDGFLVVECPNCTLGTLVESEENEYADDEDDLLDCSYCQYSQGFEPVMDGPGYWAPRIALASTFGHPKWVAGWLGIDSDRVEVTIND